MLINLSGFEDIEDKFVSPSEFLFQRHGEAIIVSTFAEKIGGVTDAKSCIDHFVPDEYQKKFEGKIVSMYGNNLHYYPYYRGYCFDIHFSEFGEPTANLRKINEVLDSIKFIDGNFTNVQIKKFFYIGSQRLQLMIPENWKITTLPGNSEIPATLKFRPATGNDFLMLVTPYPGSLVSELQVKKAEEDARKKMAIAAKGAVETPVLQELKKNNVTIYYYSIADKTHNPEDPGDYPFIAQGYASVKTSDRSLSSILYFTILYRKDGLAAAKQGIGSIANAKILNL